MSSNNESIFTKAVLTFQEAVEYTGFSAAYLYKLTSAKTIPHNKPNGKAIFFDRRELEDWLMGRSKAPAADDARFRDGWAREDIEDLVRWVMAKYQCRSKTEHALASVAKYNEPGKRLSPDFVLDYLYENYDLDVLCREDLNYDRDTLRAEKKRRADLGLPLFWEDWDDENFSIFIHLGIPEEKSSQFYDTDCPHSAEDCLRWISKNIYHGKKSPADLRAQYEAAKVH